MTIQNNQRALCECISTRTGSYTIVGKQEPVFILELNAIESGKLLIKYLGCKSSTKGCYTVGHNSDFAKLYRLTLGENPKKRFSEAKHLLGHFVESRFFAEYKSAFGSTGKHYLKVTHIEPENPCKNNEWTASGALKKVRKKSKKPPPEVPDKYRNITGQVPDDKTLQAASSLGFEPVFNPAKKPPIQDKIISHKNIPTETNYFLNLPPDALAFYKDRLYVLLNHFEFEKVEAVELAQQATIMQFSEKTAMPYMARAKQHERIK